MRLFIIFILYMLLGTGSVAAQGLNTKSSDIVVVEGKSYYVHMVQKGETVYSLSKLYGVSQRELVDSNPQLTEGLKAGGAIKVPLVKGKEKKMSKRKVKKTFDTHEVKSGETLYAISKKYGITVSALMEDNKGLDPAKLSIGRKLLIRKASQGRVTDEEEINEQLEGYRDAVNSVATKETLHLVKKGETLYSLSRQYGVTEEELIGTNNITGVLKAGAFLKIPLAPQEIEERLRKEDDTYGTLSIADLRAKSSAEEVEEETSELTVVEKPMLNNEINHEIADLSANPQVNVALLLPLNNEKGEVITSFVDFYHGVLLGLEDLKQEGISAKLSLFNTGREQSDIHNITASYEFANTDLIIGPVFEDNIEYALEYAERNRVAVVSPLAHLENVSSSLIFQMAPSVDKKYDKLVEMLNVGEPNIVYLDTQSSDYDMDMNLKPLIPEEAKRVMYYKEMDAESLEELLLPGVQNIFIVSCNSELLADEIMAKLSSIINNITARTKRGIKLRIIGNSKWARPQSTMDRELFFKLGLCYVTTYQADSGSSKVKNFGQRHVAAFGSLPSLYSYRGYDAVKMFVKAAKTTDGDFVSKLNNEGMQDGLLQMKYHFKQRNVGSSYVNDSWALVKYNNNFTIEVK